MTTKPLFSLITITKDNLSGLQGTAQSIVGQSSRKYEWIIIDGSSTDGTADYLASLPAVGVSEPDGGIYDAMNKGLARADGDYILFLNAGDRLADMDILSLIEKHISLSSADFLYGDALEEIGGKLMVKKARPHTKIARGMFTSHQAMLYRRDRIGLLRFDTSYKIAGDYDFTARFLKICRTIEYIPAGLCITEAGGVSQLNAGLGRREERAAKIKNEICHPFHAYLVSMIQLVALCVRRIIPGLYRRYQS